MSKHIILCSDGTGQKGGYGADSNVYKLYKAVDIHTEKLKQITFYDNGVGTTENNSDSKSNKFKRAISGAFGFGFANNVCDLYRFLTLNYEVGDKIYFFGFSRGAATVRACAGFINTCGLLDKSKQPDIEKGIEHAFDAYKHRKTDSKKAEEFKKSYAIHDNKFAPNGDLIIHFIGVWDTVSALGFPFEWLDKVSDQFFPHRFYKYGLDKSIENAYQALSIDDARKVFHPKVWNETKPEYKPVNVEQVWFPGVHSNVGGGYPRTGLSDVAFEWMIVRAEHHGLVFIKDDVDAVKAHANPQGKLFDSRDGFGIYYSYQPRDLAALCIDEDDKTNKLRGKIKIHSSAIERIKRWTAEYAPSFIPAEFEISETPINAPTKPIKWDGQCDDVVTNVARRQCLQNLFYIFTLALIFISGWLWIDPPDSVIKIVCIACGVEPDNSIWHWIYSLLTYLTPVFFENFLAYAILVKPIVFIILVAAGVALYRARKSVVNSLNKALQKCRLSLLKAI